jgi:hypothetical protein
MRTIGQIEQEILQAKNQEAELAGLNSVSQTAIWRLWVKITAFMHNVLEKLFDKFSVEIFGLIAQNRPGTLAWYVQKARSFQNGDTLNSLGEYDVIDANKQIITRCSVREITGGVSIKIAKSEPPVQLSAVELQNFTAYISKVKFAGVGVNIVNLPADTVLVNIEIFYSQIGEEEAKNAVKEAINNYIKSISFDGDFVVNDMIVACRQPQGVIDVLVANVEISGDTVVGRYTAISGYYSFDAEDVLNNYVMTAL